MSIKTIYLNMRASDGTRETVDEFTPGLDAPSGAAFRRYVSDMVNEYHMAGMPVYTSQRACEGWKQ